MSTSPAATGSGPTGSNAQTSADQQQAQWEAEQRQQAQAMNSSAPTNPGPVKVTQYGYADDTTPDYNSNVAKIGNRDNPLTPHAAALTDSEAATLHAQPGDVIRVGSQKFYYADRAPEKDNRVDLYKPNGFDNSIPDSSGDVEDLGGGSGNLKGQALANVGEANVSGVSPRALPVNNQSVAVTTVSGQPNQSGGITQFGKNVASILTGIPVDSARASNNSQGIAFINLLKRLNYGSGSNPFSNVNTSGSS